MQLKLQDILPVVLSVMVIVLVAIIERQSKTFAAITATMPLTIPLTLWIVYSSNNGDKLVMSSFAQNLFFSILPTVAFVIAIWLAARAGYKLLPLLGIGYAVWAIGSGLMLILRRWLGLG